MKWIIALVFIATSAHAQTAADEPAYALVMATTAAPALIFDILVSTQLIQEGTVRRGWAINSIAFGGVATTIGVLLAATFWGDTRVKPIWTPLSVGLATVGVGSIVLGIWGLVHPRAVPVPVPQKAPLPQRIPGGDDDYVPLTPPPLPNDAQSISVTPLFGFSPRGDLFFGLDGTL